MLKMPQIDIPLTHFFADGVYGRQGVIPKGCLLTGRIHTQSQLNIISKGKIAVIKGNGEEVEILEAPCTFVSPPGTKRVGYTLEETVFTTILGTELSDVSQIENLLTVNTEEDYSEFERLKCSQSLQLSPPSD